MTASARLRTRVAPVVRFAGLLLVLPFVLLLGVNTFVNLWLPRLLNLQPERVRITYDVAWMIRPFEVEVRQLQIRSQSPQDQLVVEVDRATATIDVAALLDRTFSAHTIEARGASFRYRIRADAPPPAPPPAPPDVPPVVAGSAAPSAPAAPSAAPSAAPAAAAAAAAAAARRTPPIAGLRNPPVPRPEDLYPAPGEVWTIRLADVTVEGVREIWLEDYHFVGDARITSESFLLQPTRYVATSGTVLDIRDGQVLTGDEPLLVGLHGTLTVGLDGLRPQDHPGRTVFGLLSAHAALDARVKDLAFLDYYLRKAPWLGIHGGAGDLHADLTLESGRFLQGSVLTANVEDIAARFLSYSVVGDGAVRVEVVAAADGSPEARLAVDFDDYAIDRDGDATPHAEGRGFRVTARTADVALDAAFTALDIVLEIPSSGVPDVGVYNAYLPRDLGLTLRDGVGEVHGRLEVSTVGNVGHGELFLTARELSATLDDLTLTGDLAVHAVVPEARLDEGRYDLSGTRIELRNVGIANATVKRRGKDGSEGWWATLTVPRGHAASGAAVFLDTDLVLTLRDTVPFITLFSEKQHLPGWVRGLLAIDDVSGEARILLGDDVLHVPSFEVRGAKGFALSLELRRKRLLFYGKLHARYGPLSLGMQLRGAERRIRLVDTRKWYDAEPSVQ